MKRSISAPSSEQEGEKDARVLESEPGEIVEEEPSLKKSKLEDRKAKLAEWKNKRLNKAQSSSSLSTQESSLTSELVDRPESNRTTQSHVEEKSISSDELAFPPLANGSTRGGHGSSEERLGSIVSMAQNTSGIVVSRRPTRPKTQDGMHASTSSSSMTSSATVPAAGRGGIAGLGSGLKTFGGLLGMPKSKANKTTEEDRPSETMTREQKQRFKRREAAARRDQKETVRTFVEDISIFENAGRQTESRSEDGTLGKEEGIEGEEEDPFDSYVRNIESYVKTLRGGRELIEGTDFSGSTVEASSSSTMDVDDVESGQEPRSMSVSLEDILSGNIPDSVSISGKENGNSQSMDRGLAPTDESSSSKKKKKKKSKTSQSKASTSAGMAVDADLSSSDDDDGGENVDRGDKEEDFLDALRSVAAAADREKEEEERERREMLKNDDDMLDDSKLSDSEEYLGTVVRTEERAINKKDLKPVDHSKMEYIPFRKNFWIDPPDVTRYSTAEIDALRRELDNIRVRGKGCPCPVRSWHQSGLPKKILSVLAKNEMEKPFPIQSQAIPAIMKGRDVIGIAKTGSGKTLAFVLPLIRHIMDQPELSPGDGPIGLIMAPTRELAVQIFRDARLFCRPLNLKVVCVYGGAAISEQIADLKRGAEIVVCTPGRMIDLLCANHGRVTNLRRVSYVVLDEADRMFDLGFGPQVTRVIDNIQPKRQTVMFSATFPKQVEFLARKILHKPLEIVIGGRSVATSTVEQHIEIVPDEKKFLRLLELLGEWNGKGSILVFVDKQTEADDLLHDLLRAGYDCLSLHGGKDQIDREFTISQFKRGEKTLMVSTSIAARGLDVKSLILVVNYNVPNHSEDYVHRIGRTGRAGRQGYAYTFITSEEDRYAPDLVRILEKSNSEVPEELKKMAKDFIEKNQGKFELHNGFRGSGFKFTLEEQEAVRRAERQQAKASGLVEAGELSDEEEDLNPDADDGIPSVEDRDVQEERSKIVAERKKKAKEEAAKQPEAEVEDDSVRLQKLLRAKATAAKLSVEVNRAIESGKDMSKEVNQHFLEFEINDYPQHCRWKITNREAQDRWAEEYQTCITQKGVFVQKGQRLAEGDKKLYLLMEGPDLNKLILCRREMKRILDEQLAKMAERGQLGGNTRYSVL